MFLELSHEIRGPVLALMREHGVTYLDGATVVAVGEGWVRYAKDGEEREVPCDTAVTSFGLCPDEDVVDALHYVVPESYVVGDAQQARTIYWANMSAFDCAVEIRGRDE